LLLGPRSGCVQAHWEHCRWSRRTSNWPWCYYWTQSRLSALTCIKKQFSTWTRIRINEKEWSSTYFLVQFVFSKDGGYRPCQEMPVMPPRYHFQSQMLHHILPILIHVSHGCANERKPIPLCCP
jgi:hypothetical protein